MTKNVIPEAKKCPDCGEWKLAADFGRNKRMGDGLARYCKECFGKRSRASYRKRRALAGKQVREARDVPEGRKYCPRVRTGDVPGRVREQPLGPGWPDELLQTLSQ